MNVPSYFKKVFYRLYLGKKESGIPPSNRETSYAELAEKERDLIYNILKNNLSMTSENNLATTALACKYIINKEIEGDFIECGVWRGGHSIVAAAMLGEIGRKAYLLDTYTGMTAPEDNDIRINDGQRARSIFAKNALGPDSSNWCYASIEEVKNNLKSAGLEHLIQNGQVNFLIGKAEEVLIDAKTSLPEKISCLRLDTDWYSSTKIELEILWPRLTQGGVIIIDDYGYWDGCRRAVDEYFSNHKIFMAPIDQNARVAIKIE